MNGPPDAARPYGLYGARGLYGTHEQALKISLRTFPPSGHYTVMKHLCDDELERYYLGILSESEVEPLEIHLLTCGTCIDRLIEAERYVDAMRSAIVSHGLDLEVSPE